MSLSFRNLVLLALLCAFVTSVSILPSAHRKFNQHMVKVHESSTSFAAHQQSSTDASAFSKNIQKIIDTISGSVQPNVPSIIETKNLPTFAFDRSSCDSLSADQKKQILAKTKTAKDSITSFKKNVTDDRISADASNSFQYLSVVERLVNSQCSDITTYLLIGPTPYQTNLNTQKSWLLGGITMDDLVKDYINRIKNNDNVTNCGNDTPFWNGFSCISCNDPKPIFNIATRECVACPTGQVFDLTTRTCKDSGIKNYKPNAAAESKLLVPTGAPTDAIPKYMNTGDVPCPADKPFVKDNTCIPCPVDKPYFNLIAKECQNCPTNYIWDPTNHRCNAGKPNATDVPLYTPRLVMNDNSTSADWDKYVKENENKIFCPQDKPFWTGTECIQCPDLFNVITRKCVVCEPGLSIHTDTHKCDPANKLEPSLKDLFNAIF